MGFKKLATAVAVGFLSSSDAKVTIEPMRHDIQQITGQNFDGVISKFRDTAVGVVWYFRDDNKADEAVLSEYNEVAKDMKGMAIVTALNCNDYSVFCKNEGVKETPSIKIYPPNPIPAFVYDGKHEKAAIVGKVSKFIKNLATELTKESHDTWLTTDPTKPKLMLFTNKKTVPTIWKALSSETVFKRTVKFGYSLGEDSDVAKKMKITKYPSVVMIRGAKADTTEHYKGEINFQSLREWVNLHSESGMGDKVQSGAGGEEESIEDAKPWLIQEVPELTAKSQKDICFKGEGLCVIYLRDGPVTQEETDTLTRLSRKYTSQLSDRGAKMKWMWLDTGLEKEFKELFEPAQLPSAVVFNPHKRLRFTKIDHGEDNDVKGDEHAIVNLMEKVLGGDARFKMVPGQKLPNWAARDTAAKKKTEL